MEDRGENPNSLSPKVKVSQPTILRIASGETPDPKDGTVTKLARFFGVTNDQLRGRVPLDKKGVVPTDSPNSIPVKVFDVEASMGLGKAQPENDTVVGTLQLNINWVRQQLPSISSPNNLAVMTAYGDSMSPTFSDGDMILVDRGVADVKLDAVYVLAFNNELFVKRIQRRMDGAVVIKSDNPLYDPHVVHNGERESLQVLGRVVWAWSGKKL